MTNEHWMITVVPIGVNVGSNDWLVSVWAAGKVPDAKPIIVPMLPDVGMTNCGVYAVVGRPVPVKEYNPVAGLVYVPMVVGTENNKTWML